MKQLKLLQNLPSQTLKISKYEFVIKQVDGGYSLVGYRWNHRNTFIVSKYNDDGFNTCGFTNLDCVKEMINFLVTDKIF